MKGAHPIFQAIKLYSRNLEIFFSVLLVLSFRLSETIVRALFTLANGTIRQQQLHSSFLAVLSRPPEWRSAFFILRVGISAMSKKQSRKTLTAPS
jgi:hypothetical protein